MRRYFQASWPIRQDEIIKPSFGEAAHKRLSPARNTYPMAVFVLQIMIRMDW